MSGVKVLSVDLNTIDGVLRTPFRFGITTLSELPHLIVSVTASVDGETVTGHAADNLPPKWFSKRPEAQPTEEIQELIDTVKHAAGVAVSAGSFRSPFLWWQEMYQKQAKWGEDRALDPLLYNFGLTLVERGLLDAYCRAKNVTFSTAIRKNMFGIELSAIHPELRGSTPSDYVPAVPASSIAVRHTIGLSDSIRTDDVEQRIGDGLPECLEDAISRYNLSYFKVKIAGNPARDVERVSSVHRCAMDAGATNYLMSLDGNESYSEASEFKQGYKALLDDVPEIAEHLLFIEQPLRRGTALTSTTSDMFSTWPDRPPVIIDESDGTLGSLREALAAGYSGTSFKSCKGIFKGIANYCYVVYLNDRRQSDRRVIISGEDLSNIGPVALLQDNAVAATLGLAHVERNGHHFYRGLSVFPEALQRSVVEHHPDLYTWHKKGYATLRILGGRISTSSSVDAPFGYAADLSFAGFTHLDAIS